MINYILVEVNNFRDVLLLLNTWTNGVFCPMIVLIIWVAAFVAVSGKSLQSNKPAIIVSFFVSLIVSIIFNFLGLINFSAVALSLLGFIIGSFLP